MARVAVGIGLREPYVEDLIALRDSADLDVLEVMIDEVLHPGARREQYRRLGARWPLVAHGTELGIANAEGLDEHYLDHINEALRSMHVHWYSEHLAYLSAGGIALGHFGPTFDDPESLEVLGRNAARAQRDLPCPMLLENAADVLGADPVGDEEAGTRHGRAFGRALEAARCGALLDLTNLVLNARNQAFDATRFMSALDLERVVEVHLAGGKSWDGLWIDSHDHPVDETALSLLPDVVRRAPNLRAIIIERDDRLPPLPQLLDEVARVREVIGST